MKKIIAALSVTALALCAAFADVSLEYTQKADFIGDNGNLKYTGYAKNKGCVKFTLKNDNAGVQLDVDPTIAKAAEGTRTIEFDHYYGWVNFFNGAFTLQSGVWETRSVNRMNKDAGKWEGKQYERYKYGVANGEVAKDINNIATVNGTTALSTSLTYKADGLYATGILVTNAYDAASGINSQSGWGVETGMNIGEGSKLTAMFKNPAKNAYAFAGFLENKTLKENLDFVVGFTFGRAASTNIEWAIDARARYDLADNMALTTMNNLTYKGAEKDFSVWDMVSLTLKASEKIDVLMTVEWEYQKFDSSYTGMLDLIPSIKYTAAKGVDISSGIIISTTGWSRPTSATVEIPFMLHVAL